MSRVKTNARGIVNQMVQLCDIHIYPIIGQKPRRTKTPVFYQVGQKPRSLKYMGGQKPRF